MKYKGFTLIEILIVLIVIGILATLLMPQLTGMAERARTVEAKNTMSAIRTAIMAFYIETAPTMPASATTSAAVNTTVGTLVGPSTKRLFEYGYTSSGTTATILAERNVNKGGDGLAQHSRLRMIVYGDGSADDIETKYQTGAGIATTAAPAW